MEVQMKIGLLLSSHSTLSHGAFADTTLGLFTGNKVEKRNRTLQFLKQPLGGGPSRVQAWRNVASDTTLLGSVLRLSRAELILKL